MPGLQGKRPGQSRQQSTILDGITRAKRRRAAFPASRARREVNACSGYAGTTGALVAATGTLQPQGLTTYQYGASCSPTRQRASSTPCGRAASTRAPSLGSASPWPVRSCPATRTARSKAAPSIRRYQSRPAVGRAGGIRGASMRICRRWQPPARPAFPSSGTRRSCAVRCSSSSSALPPAA